MTTRNTTTVQEPADAAALKRAAAAKAATTKAAATKTAVTVAKPETQRYDIDSWKALKREASEAMAALMYDARRARPLGSSTVEEAVAKVNALIGAYREFVRLLQQETRTLQKGV